jgi:uncharacterized membrane protein
MALVLLQGMCPMCAGMGIWMVLFWVVVLVAIVALVWLLVRRNRS